MRIKSKIKDYSVELCEDILDKEKEILSLGNYDKLFYFVDANVHRLYKKKLQHFINGNFCLVIEALETNKEYLRIADYYRVLIENNFTRNDLLITIGGGILQDISGFIASTLYRGIHWVFLPTTLLAQADSCIGSKTSINFAKSKNLIGTFYPPDAIFIDPKFCSTPTDEYFNSGVGEIIKFHLMSSSKEYAVLRKYLSSANLRDNALLNDIILSTLKIKRSYFEEDEFDSGRRNLLNYGHCFGHALESATNFSVSHGEAVLVGIGFANLLSVNRGLMSKQKYDEFEQLIRPYYPRFDLTSLTAEDLIKYLKRDKKRIGNKLSMILSMDIGIQIKLNDIEEPEFKENFKKFLEYYTTTILGKIK